MEEKIRWIDRKATGRKIQHMMDERGLSAVRVSEELGLLSAQAVYNWWWGKTVPDPDNLYGLSRILGVRTDDILMGYDQDPDRRTELHKDHREEPGGQSQALPILQKYLMLSCLSSETIRYK
jgi:transcriptional regulator with XRE-family HTH domain